MEQWKNLATRIRLRLLSEFESKKEVRKRVRLFAKSLQTDVHMKLYCVYVIYAVNLCTNAYRKLYNTVCTHMWSVEN